MQTQPIDSLLFCGLQTANRLVFVLYRAAQRLARYAPQNARALGLGGGHQSELAHLRLNTWLTRYLIPGRVA